MFLFLFLHNQNDNAGYTKKSSGPFSKNMMTICFVRRDHFFDQYFQHWVISISLFFRIFVANVYKPQI